MPASWAILARISRRPIFILSLRPIHPTTATMPTITTKRINRGHEGEEETDSDDSPHACSHWWRAEK